MITIASLLDKQANSQTVQYWDLLERECSLSAINTVPFPHFSWVTAKDPQNTGIIDLLRQITEKIPAFSVRTSGLGIFTGQSPIVYLPLIKTREVMMYHEYVWSTFYGNVDEINIHYAPENWMPHITIAFGDVLPDRLACAIQELALIDLSISIRIDNIAYLSRFDEEAKVECVIDLHD